MGLIRRIREASETKRILEHHARTLSALTGRSPDRIYREMVKLELTPNEWATQHGVDPSLLHPRSSSTAGQRPATREHLPTTRKRQGEPADGFGDYLDGLWTSVRLRPDAPRPSEDDLYEIGGMQEDLALLMAEPAPLLAETQQMPQLLIELHARGARVDAEFVNGIIRERHSGQVPTHITLLTQEEFDAWQKRVVEDRGAP